MTNRLFPKGAQRMLRGEINYQADEIGVALVSSGYTYSDSHEFLSDLAGVIVGTPVNLASKKTDGGVLDANDVSFSSIASGSQVRALVLYKNTGSPNTSPLLAFYDEVTGFPFTTNGGVIDVPWSDGAYKMISLV